MLAKGKGSLMSRNRNRSRGFTLLELSIAAGVMAVAFVVIMQSIISISSTREIVSDETVAVAVLSSLLEEIQSLSFEQLMAYQPAPSGLLGATERVRVVCFDQTGAPVPLPVTSVPQPVFPDPVEVQATVFWIDPSGKPFTRSLSAMVGR